MKNLNWFRPTSWRRARSDHFDKLSAAPPYPYAAQSADLDSPPQFDTSKKYSTQPTTYEAKEILGEKLVDSKDLPKVGQITGKMTTRWGTGTMVIPAPIEVDAAMKTVPTGKLTTINEIRGALAKKHGVDVGCPITTGIFAWIAAHAAEEAALAGKKRITPYWRTLKAGGQLNEKYPGGIPAMKKRLEAEGHKIVKRGKNYRVEDFESALYKPMLA